MPNTTKDRKTKAPAAPTVRRDEDAIFALVREAQRSLAIAPSVLAVNNVPPRPSNDGLRFGLGGESLAFKAEE